MYPSSQMGYPYFMFLFSIQSCFGIKLRMTNRYAENEFLDVQIMCELPIIWISVFFIGAVAYLQAFWAVLKSKNRKYWPDSQLEETEKGNFFREMNGVFEVMTPTFYPK